MEQEQKKTARLCSEIQLFDLCDKDVCSFRDGRFCSEPATLARFEAIIEKEDDRTPTLLADDLDDLDDDSDDQYGEYEDFEETEEDEY